jgi:O-antigen/teichoic acid export membrane protein
MQERLMANLKIRHAASLWITVLLGLSSLWLPILRGLLQGSQRFLGLGWVSILDGCGRFLGVSVALKFGGQAAGAMAGVLAGQITALFVGFYLTRDHWRGAGQSVDWASWWTRAWPLALTSSSLLVLTLADVVFVQSVFPGAQTPFYQAAQIMGVALMSLTTPLVAVMYPKIVESAARARRSDALVLALGATAGVAGVLSLGCSVFPELPLRIILFRRPELWTAATLVPWFAWALLPLVLTNVLVNNLMARERFRHAFWFVGVAGSYVGTLWFLRESLARMELFAAYKWVIGLMGSYSLLALLLAVILTRNRGTSPKEAS